MKPQSTFYWTLALSAAVGTILANVVLAVVDSAVTAIKGA